MASIVVVWLWWSLDGYEMFQRNVRMFDTIAAGALEDAPLGRVGTLANQSSAFPTDATSAFRTASFLPDQNIITQPVRTLCRLNVPPAA